MTLSTRDGKLLLKQKERNGIYLVRAMVTRTTNKTMTLDDAHDIFGHLNHQELKNMLKNISDIELCNNSKEGQSCTTCIKGKLTRANIPKESTSKTTEIGELIHSDVWGPAQIKSYQSYLKKSPRRDTQNKDPHSSH